MFQTEGEKNENTHFIFNNYFDHRADYEIIIIIIIIIGTTALFQPRLSLEVSASYPYSL
jgi:hypothetical protein